MLVSMQKHYLLGKFVGFKKTPYILVLIAAHFECKCYSTSSNIFRYTLGSSILSALREKYLQSKETNKNKEKSEKVEGK